MTSPLDSRYLKSPGSPVKDYSISPEKKLSFDDLSKNEQDEIDLLRRKISQMQAQQAERAFQYNEDCKNLELQVTNLRASVEKGEVLKQKLEYELTLVQRNLNNEKRKFSEKENSLQMSTASLKERISQLEDEVSQLQNAMKVEKEEKIEEVKQHREKETKKENENLQLKKINKKLMDSEHSLKQVQTENEKYIKELQEKCRTLETQRDSLNETVRRLMRDVEFSSGQEGRLESELLKYQEKLKQFEENIEAERSSHLETKFNFELLQVRLKDFEATEASLKECRKDLESITRDYKDLKEAMDEQLETCNELRNLMERKDHQHAMEINELSKELEGTRKRESMLSEQLDIHQTNFEALKNELNEAKKHQTNVESTYNANMKELEVVLGNFRFEEPKNEEKKITSKKKRRHSSLLFEDLRFVLRDYQTRLMDANTQAETHKKANDSLTSECQRLKQRVKEKDKILEETREQLKSTHVESARYKAECIKYENSITQQSEDSKKVAKKLGDHKEKYNQLLLQMEDLQETLAKTHEDHDIMLYAIYQHLITGHPFIHSRRDKHMTSFSASELGHMIQEQLDFRLNALKTAEEKVAKLEESLEDCQENYEKLKHTHEMNISTSKGVESGLKQKLSELEDYYKKKVHDIQKKTDKSKITLDDIWMKLDKAKQSKEELKAENSKMKDLITKLRNERGCLQMAAALLSGSLRTMSVQIVDCTLQGTIVERMQKEMNYLKQQVIDLVDILRTEICGIDGNLRPKSMRRKEPALLRFRRVAVVILAANRFYNHIQYNYGYMKIGKPSTGVKSDYIVAVHCKDTDGHHFKGLTENNLSRQRGAAVSAVEWILEPSLVSIITSTLGPLYDEMKKIPNLHGEIAIDTDDKDYTYQAYDKKPLGMFNPADEIKKSHKKLLKVLNKQYVSSVYESRISCSGDSLVNQLGSGLRRILCRLKDQRISDQYLSSTCLAKTMNSQVLAFIERLHAAEVERKILRQDVTRIKGEREEIEHLLRSERELKQSLGKEETTLRRKLGRMQSKMRDMVDANKYDALVSDLRLTMEREEKAQVQLKECTKQLADIEKRVEHHSLQEKSNENAMTETLKMLNNAKTEMNKRDEWIKKLRQNAELSEKEKTLIGRNLEDLQKAYTAIIREREIVTSYIRAVGTVLEQSRQQAKLSSTDKCDFMLPELVLPNEVLVMDGIQISNEMLACQDTVRMFYQAQNVALQEISRLCHDKEQLTRKIDVLSDEIRSQRDNVMQIRGEMNALQLANAARRKDVQNHEFVRNGIHMQGLPYPPPPLKASSVDVFLPLLSSEKNGQP